MKENKVISIIFPGNPHPFKFETIEEAIAFTMKRLDYIKEEEIIKEPIDKLFNDEPEEKEYTEASNEADEKCICFTASESGNSYAFSRR